MENNRKRITEDLKNLRINKTLNVSGVNVTAEVSTSGCNGCVFKPKSNKQECNFRDSCLAHKRKDRKSVIFKISKE